MRDDARRPLPDGSGALTVQVGRADDPRLDPGHPLKCFEDGAVVGELPLAECARRNGVASGALNVGLDADGMLGASNGLTSALTPLPPQDDAANAVADMGDATPDPTTDDAAPPPAQAAPSQAPAAVAVGPCWRYGAGGWSRQPGEVTMGTCVQELFAGQCEPPGAVAYGRWKGRTLRLVAGGVESSPNNRAFSLLAPQGPDCAILQQPQ